MPDGPPSAICLEFCVQGPGWLARVLTDWSHSVSRESGEGMVCFDPTDSSWRRPAPAPDKPRSWIMGEDPNLVGVVDQNAELRDALPDFSTLRCRPGPVRSPGKRGESARNDGDETGAKGLKGGAS